MDVSKEYIKMCEKAGEIQPGDLNLGDFYVTKIVNDYLHRICSVQMFRRLYQIRLHRQDQLQGMMRPQYDTVNLIVTFCDWIKGVTCDGFKFKECEFVTDEDSYKTMEQLWLAFVMKEKYQKTWNGEEWTNE